MKFLRTASRHAALAVVLSLQGLLCLRGEVNPGAETGLLAEGETDLVLRVGAADISRYAVAKHIAQFRRSVPNTSAEGFQNWSGLYLARQVMIAEALRLGYGERPEVRRIVETMERQILTQPSGPLYAKLAPPDEPSEEALRRAYATMTTQEARPGADFETMRPALAKHLRDQHRQRVVQARRMEILSAARLVVVNDSAEQVVQRLQETTSPEAQIPPSCLAAYADRGLATYWVDGHATDLTVEGWREQFNRQFFRRVPTDVSSLKTSIEEMVCLECDYREACLRGLDRTPQFIEDRRNFLYQQVLDLFERERLRPQIEISWAELTEHYRRNVNDYQRPVRARGRILRFATIPEAENWLRNHSECADDAGEPFVVSREHPLPGVAPTMTEMLLRMPNGRTLGPIPMVSAVLVFQKQASETEPVPLEAAADAIRETLARPRLEALERRLAHEWAGRHEVVDNLRFADFGIPEPAAKPWAAREP